MDMIDEDKFYDFGRNARIRNEPYRYDATLDWRAGWKDCDEITEEKRNEIGLMD